MNKRVINMNLKLMILLPILFLGAGSAVAQGGGKAEPNPIKFAKGKTSASVGGKVYNGAQAEYIFAARKGQTVRLKISSIPRGKLTAFKVLNDAGEPEFVSENDSNYDYIFTAPYSGNYLVWVHFRPAGKMKSAKYNLSLSIK
jgi:hypothetical protein